MDEFSLIDKIKKRLETKDARVIVGIGDDAAVLVPPNGNLITTTDCLVESVHFDLKFSSAEELGHKAIAVNLSDIAAMGGTPLYALVSLGIREGISEEFILKMYDGIKKIASQFHIAIAGGNITKSPEKFFVDVTLIGEADKYWTRSGSKPGDLIAVTGKLGASASGLELLKREGISAKTKFSNLTKAHLTPTPRINEAKALMKCSSVTSAIDISDGLSSELHHLANASGWGMEIEADRLPFANQLEEAGQLLGKSAQDFALHGGEEYELLMTVSPDKWDLALKAMKSVGTTLTQIGTVTKEHKSVLLRGVSGKTLPLSSSGWKHT